MTIEELIEELKKCNPKSKVYSYSSIDNDTKMSSLISEIIEKNDEKSKENYVVLLPYCSFI